jgi:predicted aspartyl protease
MTFTFKYKSVKLKSGKNILRPMIPLTIQAKEKIDLVGILDSGSDITIIPKEIAEAVGIDLQEENEISGISGIPVKARQAKVSVNFGRGHEIYSFNIPVLIPEKENIPIIIGRMGFFEQFKITFAEADKKIEFKKVITNLLY